MEQAFERELSPPPHTGEQPITNDGVTWRYKCQPPCLKLGPTLGYNSCSRTPRRLRLKWFSFLLSFLPCPVLHLTPFS